MNSSSQKNYVSLTKGFHKYLYKEHQKHRVIDQGKYKISIKRKWTHREYHVQNNADVSHKEVKMYVHTN